MPKIFLLLLIIIFANPWIWKIFENSSLIFFSVVIFTILIYLYQFKLLFSRKILFIVSLSLFALIVYLQWNTTNLQSLTQLENDQIRERDQRLNLYNPSLHYVRVIFYRLDLKNFYEGQFNTALTRIQRNFFESIDPSVYFFGGHPRQRVWAYEFEKFPFILAIPFLFGLYNFIKKGSWYLKTLLLISLALLSIAGHLNKLGPFVLFPFLAFVITFSLCKLNI